MENKNNPENTYDKINLPRPSSGQHGRGIRFYLAAGVLTVIPLWITFLIMRFVFGILSDVGSPGVQALSQLLHKVLPGVTEWVTPDWLQSIVAALITLAGLYILGRITSHVVGAQFIQWMDSFIDKIPFAKTIYGNTKKLLSVMQRSPGEKFERVVFIQFPTPEMKAIGIMTAQMEDEKTGEKLAAVFVPTTPNPTSGYLEVVPLKNVVMTGWGMEEAMRYIISGGASFPPKLPYRKEGEKPAN